MFGRVRLADRLAVGATILAAVAALGGLLGDVYRDNAAMIEQARTVDLATLLVAVPALPIGLWLEHAGWPSGRFVVLGVVGYLDYTYAIASFSVLVNPLTPVYIAVLGLASWSLVLLIVAFAGGWFDLDVGANLPRRFTGFVLLVSVILFAGAWLGQLVGAIGSGTTPPAAVELDLPTSPVYALDLAFALPAIALAGLYLLLGDRRGPPIALSALVFMVLILFGILGMFAYRMTEGQAVEPLVFTGFIVLAAVDMALVAIGTVPRHHHRIQAHPAHA